MGDTKRLLEQARNAAPEAHFTFDEISERRSRRSNRRRLSAAVVGLGITVAIVGGAAFAMEVSQAHRAITDPAAGGGLPAPARTVSLEAGQYSYQRIHIQEKGCPDCSGGVDLKMASWWRSDDSGRIQVLNAVNYGIRGGVFGPGQFPDEGDLSAFPTDPEALKTFLLERSAPDGASPRPDVTPAPGVGVQDGQLWLAIHDYLGSTQYLNATPELRAALLQVLATDPMVSEERGATDPMGRAAIALRFHAYEADVSVFVDPTTGDFLATTERYADGSSGSVVVEQAGIVGSDQAPPHGVGQTVPPAP